MKNTQEIVFNVENNRQTWNKIDSSTGKSRKITCVFGSTSLGGPIKATMPRKPENPIYCFFCYYHFRKTIPCINNTLSKRPLPHFCLHSHLLYCQAMALRSLSSVEELFCTYFVHNFHYLKRFYQIPSQPPPFLCIKLCHLQLLLIAE